MSEKPIAFPRAEPAPAPELESGTYPRVRMRRNRAADWSRRLVAENRLAPADLIWPVFVRDGDGGAEDVASMPGVQRLTIDLLVARAAEARDLEIPVIAIFPVVDPALKNLTGDEATNPDNLICRAVRAVKAAVPDIGILCDVALDPFTDTGHDGVVRDGYVVNDETVEILVAQALVQVEAGCDIIAPSDMMDGRVGAIRQGLEAARHANARIMAYAAKYASAFFGPFRDAEIGRASCRERV